MHFKEQLIITNNILNLCLKNDISIVSAESCTGGLLANNLTKLSNSSKYFQIGLITYSNNAKIEILKVKSFDMLC